jgi:3-isopropylmalate/(R)-2-methylmalate dehydratase small subunit
MKDFIRGKAYVVGDDIDTDQIIPAKHLVYSLSDPEERKLYGRYAMSGIPDALSGLPKGRIRFVEDGQDQSAYKVIVGGKNFGCGSSREHAAVCLQIAGIEAVVAESYARIFYRNAVDGGFFVPFEASDHMCREIETGNELEIDVSRGVLQNLTKGIQYKLKPLGDLIEILKAGDVFEYARKKGLIKQ